jgi:hypothetical protein
MESVIKTHAFDTDFVMLEQMSVMYSVTPFSFTVAFSRDLAF